jgi:hypothetical protein
MGVKKTATVPRVESVRPTRVARMAYARPVPSAPKNGAVAPLKRAGDVGGDPVEEDGQEEHRDASRVGRRAFVSGGRQGDDRHAHETNQEHDAARGARHRTSPDGGDAALERGTAPLIIPVMAVGTVSSATAKRTNGIAIQMAPSRTIFGQSPRSTGARDLGSTPSATIPNAIRRSGTIPAPNVSTPTRMKRNEAPQMSAQRAVRPHSTPPKCPGVWAPVSTSTPG